MLTEINLKTRILLGLLSVALIATGFWMFHPMLMPYDSDGAVFFILAQSIALGKGYFLNSLPVPQPHFTFPPVYPTILALGMSLAKDTSPAFITLGKWLTWAQFGSVLGVLFALGRRWLGSQWALLWIALTAVFAVFYRYAGDLLSDYTYLLMSVLTLGFVLKASEAHARKYWLVALLCMTLTVLTRPVGLSLTVAWLLFELLERNWRRLILVGLVAGLAFGGWSVFEHNYRETHPTEEVAVAAILEKSPVKFGFLKYFLVLKPEDEEAPLTVDGPLTLLQSAGHRVEQYGRMIATQFFPSEKPIPKGLTVLWMILTAGASLYGGWRLWREPIRAVRLIPLYVLVYLGVLCVYPYVSIRYLLPVIPFLLLLYGVGLSRLIERFGLPTRLVMGLAVVFILLAQLPPAFQFVQQQHEIQVATREGNPFVTTKFATWQEAMRIIREELPVQSVVITRKPEILYISTGCKAFRFPFYTTQEKLLAWLQGKQREYARDFPGGVYVLEEDYFKESRKLLSPVIAKFPAAFYPVWSAQAEHLPRQVILWKL